MSRKKQRTCGGKRRFRDANEARQSMRYVRSHSSRRKVPCRVYFCPACKGWHQTSRT